ncbi:hypothetical protein [Bradyrhizobium sp. dw_78]|nr:hypothetical protein [Bradyrhizobium sp. dw_78]
MTQALLFCFDAFSSHEPEAALLENAIVMVRYDSAGLPRVVT